MARTVTQAEFDELLKGDKLIVADFFATWCGPCQMMTPIMEELEKEYEKNDKIEIVKVDIDQDPDLSGKYSVMSVPTFLLIKNEAVLEQMIGAVSKDILEKKIKQYIK